MKPRRSKTVSLPRVELRTEVARASANAEERTVEATFYTGAEVIRSPLFADPFLLSFSLKRGAARLGRLNGGAPVLDSHDRYSGVGSVLGKVESARVDEKLGGVATLRFSKRPELDGIWQDIQDGILANLSMGAVVHELEELEADEATGLKRFLATDWEPQEISLLAVGADPGARIQLSETAEDDRRPCRFTFTEATMKVRLIATNEIVEIEESDFDEKLHSKSLETPPAPRRKAKENGDDENESAIAAARKVDAAIERDQKLASQIRRAAEHFGLDENWAIQHINARTPIDKVLELGAEERARRQPPMRNGVGDDYESKPYRFEQMASALAFRAKRAKPDEAARPYYHMSVVEIAFEVLKARGEHRGLDPRGHPSRVVELALSSSDYPNLLANAANKILLPDYEHATPTYRFLAARQDLPDFKTASVLKAGDFPIPIQVGEEGEIQLGKFTEAKDSFALVTYGRRLLFSFQMMMNDDLNAFNRIMSSAAIRLADFENALWFASLISAAGAGPTLGDTGALYNSTAVTTVGGHANLTSSGTAISIDSIGVGRASMRKQVSLDGLKLNIVPKYIVTSPDKETLARQFTTVLGPNLAAGSQNPWAGQLEPLADANLVSANPWYLFADPARAQVSVYGYLSGSSGPQVAARQGFEVLGTEMRVALHFGFAFIDFRGTYRNAGA